MRGESIPGKPGSYRLNACISHQPQSERQDIDRGQGDDSRNPVEGFIIIPLPAGPGIYVSNIRKDGGDSYEDSRLNAQDIGEDVTLCEQTQSSSQTDFGLIIQSHAVARCPFGLISLQSKYRNFISTAS